MKKPDFKDIQKEGYSKGDRYSWGFMRADELWQTYHNWYIKEKCIRKEELDMGNSTASFGKAGDSYCKGKKEDLPGEEER